MFKIIRRVVRAPLTYLADLRKLSFRQYLMLNNNFSPSYPIMVFTSLITTLLLAAYIIYFIITTPGNSICFDNVRGGAYVISFMYPIQTVLCFICLTATIALSQNTCWKITWIIIFGPILCGFGFSELALIQMCLLGVQNEDTFQVISILKQPSFIAAMVYLYISLVVLYFVLVPAIQYLYKRQKEDEQKAELKKKELETQRKSLTKKPQQNTLQKYAEQEQDLQNEKKSCCSRFICILYYFLHIVFFFTALFILFVKVLGPVLFTFIWVEMATSPYNFDQTGQKIIFSLSLVAYFSPLGVNLITLLIQLIVRQFRKKSQLQQIETQSKARETIEITQAQGRESKTVNDNVENQIDPNNSTIRDNQKQASQNIEKNLEEAQIQGEIAKKQRRQSLI